MARQFHPRVLVMLHPIVSEGETKNITEWFGESCVISTSKGIMEPSGTFSISFLDRRDGNSSIYARVHPMDGIEIMAVHDGKKPLKTIMRGFVSRVSREEGLDEDGTPVRRVSITGEDVGKIWLTQYLYFLPTAQDQIRTISGFGIHANYFHSNPKNMTGAEFIEKLGSVLAGHVDTLTANTKMGLSLGFAPEGKGLIAPHLLQGSHDISFYQFMASLLDAGAFHELWIDDPGQGPALIRWRDLWSGPAGEHINQDQIASIRAWRDDSSVSNWYFCYPRAGVLVTQTDAYIEALRAGDVCDGRTEDRWSLEKHFGWRKMEVNFALRPEGFSSNNDQTKKSQYEQSVPIMSEYIKAQTLRLRNLNKDNSRLESCTAVVEGNEEIRPGTWVTMQKSEAAWMFYAVKVEHQIHLFNSFKTTVHGMRGERLSGDDSYREELDLKGTLK